MKGERKSYEEMFSKSEREEISNAARSLADIGEEAITETIGVRNNMWMHLIELQLDKNSDPKHVEGFRHELEVVKAILDQARTQHQFRGLDSDSQLDELLKKKGYGSLFDKESRAYKEFGFGFLDDELN